MARRRRVTLGRALALMLLGITVGASLFLFRHLRPDAIERQFREALEAQLATDYELDDILLDVNTGIEVLGLKIYYPDGALAVGIQRMGLTISHQDLLAGHVRITQVDMHGLVMRLRPKDSGGPGLPGVFREADQTGPAQEQAEKPPLIRVMPGDHGSRVEFVDLPHLKPGEVIGMAVERFEGHPDGPLYTATARLSGARTKRLDLRMTLDPVRKELEVDATATEFSWTRDDVGLLSETVRDVLPPVEAGGIADATLSTKLRLDPFEVLDLSTDVSVDDLHGAFGNLHTGDAKGLPFGFQGGRGTLHYRNGELWFRQFQADYVAPTGEVGRLIVDLDADLRMVTPHVDFTLTAKDITATTDDLRELLDPAVIEPIVNQFQPSGRLAFVFRMSQRPALPDKYWLDLSLLEIDGVYAGRLDELTGRRYGFLYPVRNASGRIFVESEMPTPRGPAESVVIRSFEGSNQIAKRIPGQPERVQVRAQGSILAYYLPAHDPREDIDLVIEIDDLPIDAKLARAFSASPTGMPYEGFNLEGWAKKVRIALERDAATDRAARASYDIELEDCSMAYEKFPLPIHGISGRILSTDLPERVDGLARRTLELDLAGTASGGGSITGRGTIDQVGDLAKVRIDVSSPDLRIGSDLRQALGAAPGVPGSMVQLWDRIRPDGRLAVDVVLSSEQAPRIDLRLDGRCGLRAWEGRELPITGLFGGIEYRGGTVTISDLRGEANRAPFRMSGTIHDDGAMLLSGRINRLYLERPVRELLHDVAPDAAAAIRTLELESRSALDVQLRLERRDADAPIRTRARLDKLDLVSRVQGLEVAIRGGPVVATSESVVAKDLVLTDGDAEVYLHEADLPRGERRRGWIELDARDLESGRHLHRFFGAEARRVFGDNLRVDLTDFEAEIHRDTASAVLRGRVDLRRHEVVAETPDALEPTGTFVLTPLTLRLTRGGPASSRYHGIVQFRDLNMRLPVPAFDMSGELRIADGTFAPFSCRGAVFDGEATAYDRYFDRLALNLTIDPEFVRLNNIDGRLYGGRLRGDIDVHQRDPDAFRLRLRASSVELAAMFERDLPRDNPMTGLIDAEVEIESRTGEPADLRGKGSLRVRNGQLFKIPGLRSILAVLARATPLDGPRFKRAEANFTIRGETIEVERYHLSTKINDVKGKGTISVYGDLDLVVQPQVTRLIDVTRLLDIPFLSVLRNAWHRAVYEFRLEGTLKSPNLRIRALPFLKRTPRRLIQSAHAGSVKRIRPGVLPR